MGIAPDDLRQLGFYGVTYLASAWVVANAVAFGLGDDVYFGISKEGLAVVFFNKLVGRFISGENKSGFFGCVGAA